MQNTQKHIVTALKTHANHTCLTSSVCGIFTTCFQPKMSTTYLQKTRKKLSTFVEKQPILWYILTQRGGFLRIIQQRCTLQQQPTAPVQADLKPYVVLFLSFDIVNSTQYKSTHKGEWTADISSSCEQTDNIYTEFQINDNRKQGEFIGSDIDAGFRLSYYGTKNQLLISYKITYVLANHGQIDEINLLTYRQLEGIWNGNPTLFLCIAAPKRDQPILCATTHQLWTMRYFSAMKSA